MYLKIKDTIINISIIDCCYIETIECVTAEDNSSKSYLLKMFGDSRTFPLDLSFFEYKDAKKVFDQIATYHNALEVQDEIPDVLI